MAEESPRPPSAEDSEEEGEEAAEAPLLLNDKNEESAEAPLLNDKNEESAEDEQEGTEDSDKEAAPAPEPPAEKKAPVSASKPSAQPLLPMPPAFFQPATTYYTPAVPAYPSTTSGVNVFANDGSFLELFKKKMEQNTTGNKEESGPQEEKKPEPDKRKPISFVGKRRGGAKLALKTGMVAKKPKTDDEEVVVQKGGAWAQYMAEVKKYKAHQCSDDDKTRPLVK